MGLNRRTVGQRFTAVVSAILAGMVVGCGPTFTAPAPWASGAAVRSLGYTSSGLKLHVLPEAGISSVVDYIRSAKTSVSMKMYIMTEPAIVDALVQANKRLKKRKDGSPAVKVLLEHWYYDFSDPAAIKKIFNPRNEQSAQALEAGGVEVKWAMNRENQGQGEWFNLTHEKSIIVDAGTPKATAMIMTANMSNSAFTKNREYLIVDTNPDEVAYIDELFQADWTGTKFRKISPNLVVSPGMGWMANNSRAQMIRLLESAQKSVVIQMEVFNDPDIIATLGMLKRRGVDVQVNLDHQDLRPNDVAEPDDIAATNLGRAGIDQVKFLHEINLHTKAIVVDGVRAYTGSVNLTRGSLDRNRELGILTDNPQIVGTILKFAERDWKASKKAPGKPVPPPPANGANAPDRIATI